MDIRRIRRLHLRRNPRLLSPRRRATGGSPTRSGGQRLILDLYRGLLLHRGDRLSSPPDVSIISSALGPSQGLPRAPAQSDQLDASLPGAAAGSPVFNFGSWRDRALGSIICAVTGDDVALSSRSILRGV